MAGGMRLRRSVTAVLVAVLAVGLGAGAAGASTCGCSKTGDYKVPATTSPAIEPDGRSPGGKYVVSTTGSSPTTLTVKRIDTNAVVYSTTVSGGNWAFSPDDDRFVLQYVSGTVNKIHNVILYDLAAKRTVASLSALTTTARTMFSPGGRYLMYSAIVGSQRTRITVVDAVSGVVSHQTEFNFSAPAGSPGDSYGTVQWGFSPDAANRTFVYGYVTGASSVQLTAVNLAKRVTVASVSFGAVGWWRFSPCGDVLGLVTQYTQSGVDVSLFSTSNQLPRIAGRSFSVASVTLSTTLASHMATVGGTSYSLTPNVADDSCPTVAAVTLSPTTVTGGKGSSATVTLTGPAHFEGVPVTLSSSNPAAVSIQGEATKTITEGLSDWRFSLVTYPVATATDVTITAKTGKVTKSTTLTVMPPALSRVDVTPPSVLGGNSATGSVVLTGPASAGGVMVDIRSANPAVASLGVSEVKVLDKASSASFAITTYPVSTETPVTISAALRNVPDLVKSGGMSVRPVALLSMHVSPTTVEPGAPSTGFVILTDPAPAGGAEVTVTSADPARAKVPATVTVPAGMSSHTFPIYTTGGGAASVLISTTLGGVTKSATLTLTPPPPPPAVSSLALPSSLALWTSGTGHVYLTGPAPGGGVTVQLTSSNPDVVDVAPSVTVPAGSSSATVAVNAGWEGSAIITATANGGSATDQVNVTDPCAGNPRCSIQ